MCFKLYETMDNRKAHSDDNTIDSFMPMLTLTTFTGEQYTSTEKDPTKSYFLCCVGAVLMHYSLQHHGLLNHTSCLQLVIVKQRWSHFSVMR